MHPAFSVLFFTTLSGAGYGLMIWAALVAMTGANTVGIPARALLMALLLGMLLCGAGLLASFWHLGKPLRAWRAFSQWRTSWLSREGVFAVACFVPAVLLAASMLPAMLDGTGRSGAPALNAAGHAIAMALVACALATVYSTAMIYASLTPIPAWRHRLVVPVYLGFAVLTGGLLLATFAAANDAAAPGKLAVLSMIALALALWLAKWRYWRDIDATPLPHTRGDAIGLPSRTASVFERPHTEANYITREMAFVVARRHATWLRRFAIAAFALLPILLLLPTFSVHLDPTPWFALAAASSVAGAFVERWLFFAEARHMVTLYY